MAQDKRLLSVKEACRYLGVSRMTLLDAEERGIIAPERTLGGHRRYTIESLRDLLHAARSRHERQERVAEPRGTFQLIQFISDLNNRARAPGSALKEALRNLVLLLHMEMGAVYLREDGRLRLEATFGIPHWFLAALGEATGDSISGEVISRRAAQAYDRRAHHGLPAQLEIGQGLCAPLIYQDEVLGCVHVITRQPHQFFPGEVNIVTTIAVYLASLVVNTRLLGQVQTRLRELALLSQLSDAQATALDGLTTGVAAVDASGAITVWNQAIEQISGVAREAVLAGGDPARLAPALAALWAALDQTRADGQVRVVYARLPRGVDLRCAVRPGCSSGGAAGAIIEVVVAAGEASLPPAGGQRALGNGSNSI